MSSNTTAEHLHFLKGLIACPKMWGAIAPPLPALPQAIAKQVDPSIPGPVLELGTGGVVTEALIARGNIAPERITAIEYDPDFVRMVSRRFPGVHVVQGDAFDLEEDVLGNGNGENFAAIVSGLPLLNHPVERRRALIEGALASSSPARPMCSALLWHAPRASSSRARRGEVTRAALVLNLPLARVWVYAAAPGYRAAGDRIGGYVCKAGAVGFCSMSCAASWSWA